MEDKLNTFFANTNFDTEEPRFGHIKRFKKRLNKPARSKYYFYKLTGVAASIILIIGFWVGKNYKENTIVLADISPQMQEAEAFFVSTITQEIKEIEKYRDVKTERVINDALNQLEKLESEYKKLVKELNKSNKDKRVVYAMISNYQNRIDILQKVLKQIEKINIQKKQENEEVHI